MDRLALQVARRFQAGDFQSITSGIEKLLKEAFQEGLNSPDNVSADSVEPELDWAAREFAAQVKNLKTHQKSDLGNIPRGQVTKIAAAAWAALYWCGVRSRGG
jgi:hypothetical protein